MRRKRALHSSKAEVPAQEPGKLSCHVNPTNLVGCFYYTYNSY